MASRNEGTQPNTVRTTATTPATTTINQGQSQVEAGWENINQQNMTPESLAALQNLIQTLEAGGTPEQRASEARRRQTQSMVEQLLASVSTGAAMTDAQGLMALNLQQAMEKNMPAISKAIEGAGTSASSMQAVLSQQATRDASLAAGALGGQLAGQYAGERSNLASTLEALTRPNNQSTDALLQAFNIARGAVTNTQRRSGGSSNRSTATTTDTGPTLTTERTGTGADSVGSITGTVPGTGSNSNNLIDIAAASNYSGDLSPIAGFRAGGRSIADFLANM